jgi:hypothetical protein
VTLLSCSAALARQSTAQADPTAAQSNSSQLPDAPDSRSAPPPSPLQTAEGTQAGAATSSSSSQSPPARLYWSSKNPNVQVTVLEDTLLRVITDTPISSKEVHEGQLLSFTLYEDVLVDDLLVIPRGATLHGVVVERKKAGKLTGSPDLILKLISLDLEGRRYRIFSYELKVDGTSKTKPTETKVKTGAVIGALVGAVFDGSASAPATAAGKLAGAGAGAALGAGVGTAVAAVTPGPVIDIPAESQIDFYLASPISVVPVSRKEAERLSEGLYSGGPVLYVRGETP